MPTTVKTSVTELPESRVRVEAEVAPEEVERRVQQAARELGRQMRVPGFRKGKVPPPVVIRRLGREAVLDEAVRSALGSWYADAIDGAGIAPVGEPELDVPRELPAEGQPLQFSIEIGVRPVAKLGEFKGLEVGRREPQVDDAQIDEEIDRLRDRLATLDTVERPAQDGDHVVVDYVGSVDGEEFEGGAGRDQLIELGSGRLVPGFEDQLVGRERGRGADGHGDVPRRLSGSRAGRQGGAVRGHGQRGQGQEPARARRRLRLRGRRTRHARGASRGHRRAPSEARRPHTRTRVRGCRGGSGRGRSRSRGAGQAGSRACARTARGHVRGAGAPGRLEGRLPSDHRARRGGARARGRARGRGRAQAGGGAGRDRRCRGDRADRRAGPRGTRALCRAAGHDRREAVRAAELGRAPGPRAPRGGDPPGDRSAGGRGKADQRRAGQGTPEAMDARQGGPAHPGQGSGQLWTPGS